MGSFANTLFTALMGWTQSAASALWSLFTNAKDNGALRWIGSHWFLLAAVLCVIGLAADLGVYLVRWRPYLVWKSFLKRRRGGENSEPPESVTDGEADTRTGPAGVPDGRRVMPEPGQTPQPAVRMTEEDEDGLERWKPAPDLPRNDAEGAAPPLVTAAGYIVPEDSPYRRPAEKRNSPDPAAETEEYADAKTIPVQPSRRRKRLNVNDLFSSPEEEIYEFDAPQNLIDRKKAYREPVYPRGWNRAKEKEE